jgi:surfeit locus 1 family protein
MFSERLAFRPQFWPTVIAVPIFLTLLGLGTWQVFRLAEKEAINAFRAERAAAPPVDLTAIPPDLAPLEFRRVRVRGTFDHGRELYVYGRSQRGNDGYYILTPLLRDGLPPVLVNRGWVPRERKEPARRAEGQVSAPSEIVGFLRRDARRGWLMPDNDEPGNHWFWFDLPAMSRSAGFSETAPFYLEADTTPNPGGIPIGGQTQIQLPSNHLQYAVTWYALAFAFAVIYVVWHRQRRARTA